MGRVRRGASPQVLHAHSVWPAANAGDGDDVDAIFLEHEQAACSRWEREVTTMAGGIPQEAQQRIDAYLAGLRARLLGVSDHEAGEFVEEIRSHLLDKVATDGPISPAALDVA